MKNKFLTATFWILILSVYSIEGIGQFRFGAFMGPALSQVDGDNLRGFRYAGVSAGLLGGYKLANGNSFVVDLGFNTLGSNKGSENIPNDGSRILLETKMQTINILGGYQFLFGDRWDGKKYYLLRGGVNYHRIITKSNSIIANSFGVPESKVKNNEFHNQFFALNLSVGKILSERFLIRFGIDFGFTNLLKSPQYNISGISPYQIYFNINYYVF